MINVWFFEKKGSILAIYFHLSHQASSEGNKEFVNPMYDGISGAQRKDLKVSYVIYKAVASKLILLFFSLESEDTENS